MTRRVTRSLAFRRLYGPDGSRTRSFRRAAVATFLVCVMLVGATVLAALASGCGRVSSSREEIEADLQLAADEAIVVKAKDKNLCLAWITGQTAVRGAQIVAFRCKSLEHVYQEVEP